MTEAKPSSSLSIEIGTDSAGLIGYRRVPAFSKRIGAGGFNAITTCHDVALKQLQDAVFSEKPGLCVGVAWLEVDGRVAPMLDEEGPDLVMH